MGYEEIIKTKRATFYTVFLIIMSVFLNQSNIIFGVNISISDIFAGLIILIMIFSKRFIIPLKEFVFFLVLSISVVFTSSVLVPMMFDFSVNHNHIFRDYIKLVVIFIYFLIGFNSCRDHDSEKIIKFFSIGTLIIGIISVLYSFFNLSFYSNTLYFGGVRFRGLMNDPNYFSILQLAGIAYYIRVKELNSTIKAFILLTLTFSIIVSGSKTGFITLLLYGLIYFFNVLSNKKRSYDKIFRNLLIVVLGLLVTIMLIQFSDSLIEPITNKFPITKRIFTVFEDFGSSVSSGGSSRSRVWSMAFELITKSPLFGIGVGTYVDLSRYLYNYGAIAHNTYLQLMVEWGGILTFVFLLYLFKNLYRVAKRKAYNLNVAVSSDIIIIFLIGSLAISLNNARFFWIVLGIIISSNRRVLNNKHRPRGGKDSE